MGGNQVRPSIGIPGIPTDNLMVRDNVEFCTGAEHVSRLAQALSSCVWKRPVA